MEGEWLGRNIKLRPTAQLRMASEREDIVQGLVPLRGITWLYGPSMSFKSFIAMSMAAAVANGSDWMGRRTSKASVIYLAAEGGGALHIRRAATEFHAGRPSPYLLLAQERPQIDTEAGAAFLRGMLAGLFPADKEPRYGKDAKGNVFRYADEDEIAREGPDPFGDAKATYNPKALRIESFAQESDGPARLLVVIDTYSQTAGGDDKVNVTAYVKALRDAMEETQEVIVSFMVIDHATKAGGSYIGSVAKLNDVDSQIEVSRDGTSQRTSLFHRKSKDGRESAPIRLELAPYVFEDYKDAYGEPLTTLVVQDGIRAASIAGLADGKAGVLLTLIMDAGGSIAEADLRDGFYVHPENAGAKPATAIKAFRRAKDRLLETETITEQDGIVSVSLV